MNIAITAPAGPVNKSKLELGLKRLKQLGYKVVRVGESCYGEYFWNSAPAERRAKEFQDFWLDPDIDLVFAARGGFGCIHLLDLIDWHLLKLHDKILCGHSDLTVLHLAFLKHGIGRSISGIMPAVEFADPSLDNLSINTFHSCLEERFEISLGGKPVRAGNVEGRIIPVTLSVLCSLVGTSHLPQFENAILCIEDINESPYRLDSYLSQLKLTGILQKLKGLIFGDFNNCGDSTELDKIISDFSESINGPVVRNVKFGHCLPRISLPVGNHVILEVNADSCIKSVDSQG